MNVLKRIFFLLDRPNQKGLYLSILRVYLSFHIIKKLLFCFSYINLIYGVNSFVINEHLAFYELINLDFFREHNRIFIFIVLMISVMFMFGVGKHVGTILLYFSIEILQRLNPYPLNGGDNLLKFILLYLTFTNCFKYFCFINKKHMSVLENFLSNLGSYSIIIHLCLVYFISGVHKVNSPVWFNGVATYYTLSIERFNGTSLNKELVKNGIFVTITTYFTVLWEISFPFLVFNKFFKKYVLFCGVILHLSIYTFMMIHDFQILYIALYGLFFNDSSFLNFFNGLRNKSLILNKLYEKMFKKHLL